MKIKNSYLGYKFKKTVIEDSLNDESDFFDVMTTEEIKNRKV